jgi:hypothetical protein
MMMLIAAVYIKKIETIPGLFKETDPQLFLHFEIYIIYVVLEQNTQQMYVLSTIVNYVPE